MLTLTEHKNKENISMIENEISKIQWYHTIDLGDGIVTNGIYDHRPLLKYYGIPASLKGKTVLDIGPADGFFSFEAEKRGAERVLAIDIDTFQDWDIKAFAKGVRQTEVEKLKTQDKYALSHKFGFDLARGILKSKIERRVVNIYELSPKAIGKFDIVMCLSLLVHLRDPIKALENISSVTKDMLILVTTITELCPDKPIAHLPGKEGHIGSWWLPNMCCLKNMLEICGFKKTRSVGTFDLVSKDGTMRNKQGVIIGYKIAQR
jgi:tRNA (mo5U34)-methyltransferase